MENIVKNFIIKVISVFLLILAIGILSWAYLNYRQAQNIVNPQRVISFSAEGKVFAKPDIAKITFSVITQGEKADIIQKENDKKITNLIGFIKGEGIKEEDIKTTGYFLNPQYDYDWCKNKKGNDRTCPPRIVGYELIQTVEVKVRDFDKINIIVGGLSERGANQISNVSFEIDDLENYKNLARIEALKKIEKRAKLISEQTSVKLGKVISISEGGVYQPLYRTMSKEMMGGEAPAPVPQASIEPGVEEISVTLTVSYEIK